MVAARRWALRIVAAATFATVAIAASGAPGAAALPGPSSLRLGFVDDTLFIGSPPSVASYWLSKAQGLGSTVVRIDALWDSIAPAYTFPAGFKPRDAGDPNYHWDVLDAAVRSAAAHHQDILLSTRAAPGWAQGPNEPSWAAVYFGSWDPNAKDYGDFAHALAQRYSGRFPDPLHPGQKLPRVTEFQAWDEPNATRYLTPQYVYGAHNRVELFSAGLYRGLLNAFYAGIKSVQPRATVVSAGTAPYGNPGNAPPADFLKSLMCLSPSLHPLRCPNPPHLDVLDHHPYGLAPNVKAHSPSNIAVPDLGKIWRILHAAQRYGHVLPAGPKQLWVAEIEFSSNPPDTLAIQARYVALTFFELWREGVTRVYWFDLQDPSNTYSFAGGGLFDLSGQPKPAAAAYRFPFVAVPARHHAVVVWGRAPSAGTVQVQRWTGRRWRTVLRLGTTSGGIFYAQRALGKNLLLRAVIGQSVSPAFATVGPGSAGL